MQLNRTPNGLTREDLKQMNENWSQIEIETAKIGQATNLSNLARLASEDAQKKSEQAVSEANSALNKVDNVQKQLSTLVVQGDSSPQAAQASVGADGTDYGGNLKNRLDAEYNKFGVRLAETGKAIGVSILDFPRQSSETDDMPRFQRAIDFLGTLGGGRLVVPHITPYLFAFKSGSTILKPTRVLIRQDNVEIVGVGKPLIEMKDLAIAYLFSIDDYASSGRDVFSAFSFAGVKNGKVSGIRFKGEYAGNEKFRYQSPRSIAVSFKGCSDCLVEDIHGEDILGNLVNVVHSYIEYDAPFKNTYNVQIKDSHAIHCLENGFNYMGGTFNSKVSGVSATRCANGLESASDGLTVDGAIFRGNRSSAVALSGKNQILNGVIGCESVVYDADGVAENNAGYGLVITGGSGVQINGGKFNDNRSFGVYIYPGVTDVDGIGIELLRNATNAANKVAIQIVGNPTKRIKRVKFTALKIESLNGVVGSIVNYSDDVTFIGNNGTFENAPSSFSFSDNCTGSKAINNRFDKSITMNDPTGESYNNGAYRIIERASLPSSGTWVSGDIIQNSSSSPGSWAEARCVQSGTFGILNGGLTTGTIASGTKNLTVQNAAGLYVGAYISIAGVSGVRKIVALDGLNITLDINADTSVSNAAVSYRTPVISVSRQNGYMNAISSPPSFIGQTAITVGSIPAVYVSVGTSSAADWIKLS